MNLCRAVHEVSEHTAPDLRLKRILVAAIVRKNEIIIPHGKDVIKPGDSVILIVKDQRFSDFNDIVSPGIPNEL